MFGPCKVCLEKDARIADLKTYIKSLEKLVLFPNSSKTEIPEVHVEADRVMSASDLISDEQRRQILESENEANSLLTGTY